MADPDGNTKKIAKTFRTALRKIAEGFGEKLAAEGEICWAGMHSWRHNVELLELVDRPKTLGFQADMAHTMLFTMGYNAPEHSLLPPGFNWSETKMLADAYRMMADALRPWTTDLHIAQNDGDVKGAGSHDRDGQALPLSSIRAAKRSTSCADAGAWMRGEDGQPTRAFRTFVGTAACFPTQR